MYSHHEESIANVVAYFKEDPQVQALLLGGSLAHGFETAASDIDVMIIVSDRDHRQRLEAGRLQFYSTDLCSYEGGYVDGKYLGRGFLEQVAARGSEPARFAFLDAQVLLSRIDGLQETLERIARYPVEEKMDRIRRFYAQFEAWNWYAGEALKLGDPYLLGVSIGKLVLFGGRLVLAHNELLYPYHKWFTRVLGTAGEKPSDLLELIESLHADASRENVQRFYETVKGFREWETPGGSWPNQFMIDSELNWLDGTTPIDDL
jgi:predicted nucleotidyltransferase